MTQAIYIFNNCFAKRSKLSWKLEAKFILISLIHPNPHRKNSFDSDLVVVVVVVVVAPHLLTYSIFRNKSTSIVLLLKFKTSIMNCPVDRIEFSLLARKELSSEKLEICNASFTSEISIDMLHKEDREDDRNNRSSNSGWNPDDSDYSLNVLLHLKDDSPSLADSAIKESLMGSNYSLDVSRKSAPKETETGSVVKESLMGSNCSLDVSLSSKTVTSPCSDSSRKSDPKEVETKPSRREPKVRFFKRVHIRRVPNREELSEEQVLDVWYSREEFKEIRQECFAAIRIMTSGDAILDDDDEEYCFRGLEYKTKAAYKERRQNKLEVRHAVLDEQEFQIENELDDPEWIAKLSRDGSRPCVRAAILAAKKDEQGSRLFLQR
jgi:hypothetical protein